jgi:hypothetical protein
MKTNAVCSGGLKAAALALIVAGIAGLAGCASGPQGPGGTANLDDSSSVQGRDWGRGGATSGGISSLDPSGNAADRSVYEARRTYAGQ